MLEPVRLSYQTDKSLEWTRVNAFPTLPILTTAFMSIRALGAPRVTARLAKCH